MNLSGKTFKVVLSAMFLAIGIVLPFITMNIPTIGNMLCPMHIPVMLCGIICGWQYGLAVGLITPILRGIMFGMPALMPNGVSMACELATYAVVIALMYDFLPKKKINIYLALLTSMVAGRIVWGIVRMAIAGITGNGFTFGMFIAGALTMAIPGIIIQLIIIPPLVILLKKQVSVETQ